MHTADVLLTLAECGPVGGVDVRPRRNSDEFTAFGSPTQLAIVLARGHEVSDADGWREEFHVSSLVEPEAPSVG